MCKALPVYSLGILLAGSLALFGCTSSASPELPSQAERAHTRAAYGQAIQRVLDQDSAYGQVRNHASETMPLAQAIRAYIANLDRIDFSGCPEAFTRAFRQHRDAWEATLPFFEPFDDLRGELHEVFEAIRSRDAETRAALEQVEAPIWSTWATVDSIVAYYDPPGLSQ